MTRSESVAFIGGMIAGVAACFVPPPFGVIAVLAIGALAGAVAVAWREKP